MAYITKEQVKTIRNTLKSEFPEIKFSITTFHYSEIRVVILKSPYFENEAKLNVNQYYIDRHFEGKQAEVLNKIKSIILEKGNHYDNSDIQSDYFDVAFYYNIEVGYWNKPHVNTL